MGMTAYEKNTGSLHPLSGGIKTSSKRSTGSDSLTDDNSDLWYGTISIGTPPVEFTGMTLSFCKRLLSDMIHIQWTLTPGVVISSCH
jgi:hypothetical protein